MTSKLVSTLIISKNHSNDCCKCEIYQYPTEDGFKFHAHIFVLRKVTMHLKQLPFNTSYDEQPKSKPVDAWVIAKFLNDLTDTSLESVEKTVSDLYLNDPFFIPSSFDNASLLM